MEINFLKARQRLAIIWFSGAGIVFIYVLILSILIGDSGSITSLFSWFLPTVMPTLSLIVSVLVTGSHQQGEPIKYVDPFLFNLAKILSIVYLSCVSFTLLAKPFYAGSLAELMSISHLWLGPIQGLVAGVLGAFFTRKERKESKEGGE